MNKKRGHVTDDKETNHTKNMTALDDLIEFGFEPITEWIMKGERIGPVSFDWKDRSGWLYAFVVDGEIQYIGLTTRVLRSRLSDYAHIKNSQTDRLRMLIVDALSSARQVKIYGWGHSDKSVLAIEESHLRKVYAPPWNLI